MRAEIVDDATGSRWWKVNHAEAELLAWTLQQREALSSTEPTRLGQPRVPDVTRGKRFQSTDEETTMRIGEAAERVGVNPKTIRYYESIGLIPEAVRTASGYRDYSPDEVERLSFVRAAQRLGLSLDQVGEVLAFREDGEQPCSYVLDIVRRQTDEIDRRVRELLDLRRELTDLIDRADRTPAAEARYCHLVETAGRSRGAHPVASGPQDATDEW